MRRPATLCIDVGGTGLKAMTIDGAGKAVSDRLRIPTPRPATPKAVLGVLTQMIATQPSFDRVSVGFPGVVVEGVIKTAPNLHESWSGFPLAQSLKAATRKPTRVLNDAGVQGYGVIEGKGVEMVITLGTGMGCALYVDGRYVPNIELAHHPFHHNKTYEDYIGDRARKRIGKRRWNRRVREVIDTLGPIFNYRVLYVGGGNAKRLNFRPPKEVRVVDNSAGLLGGFALWRNG